MSIIFPYKGDVSMYISRIEIKNFRIFDECGITIYLKKGVNAIISENNCGKTAIIDAIRIAFSTVLYKKEIYFNLSDFHIQKDGNRSEEAFINVYCDEVSYDFFNILNTENESKGEFHIRYYTVKSSDGKEKVRYNAWGGPVDGNTLSTEIFESIQLVSLDALRDAATEMRPSRSSRLASMFSTAANAQGEKDDIVNILRQANDDILKTDSLQKVEKTINDNLSTIEQDVLKQHIALGLVEPRFDSIAAALRAWIKPRWCYLEKDPQKYQVLKESFTEDDLQSNSSEDENGIFLDVGALKQKSVSDDVIKILDEISNMSFELFQNGLGYNNILFMATVLGDMEANTKSSLFNLLLVEEPEAHLHPQLQELVYSFFEKNANKENFQVIFTSHSPTLVSRIGIDRIVLLYERKHRIKCLSLSQSNIDESDRDHLERYLDVTKSQMLFAKGIIFVEGISEALLLPVFAKYMEYPLDKYAVEIVNVDGVSFKPFANLLCYANERSQSSTPDSQAQQPAAQPEANDNNQTTIPAAIITDDDRCTDNGDEKLYIEKEIHYHDTSKLSSVVSKLESGVASKRFENIHNLCEKAGIKVCGAKKTFEYALASHPQNITYLKEAILMEQPEAGKRLSEILDALNDDKEKAACIWLYVRDHSKYKGEFAQNLAYILKKQLDTRFSQPNGTEYNDKPEFEVPTYIKNAILHVARAV